MCIRDRWDEVIQQQNEKIKAYGKAHAVNMGTTVVVMLVTQKAYYIINAVSYTHIDVYKRQT